MIATLIKFLLILVLIVGIIQIGAVYLLRLMQPDLKPADLVAIMPASKERIAAGCTIAATQSEGNLLLINNSHQALKKHAEKFNVPESVTLLSGSTSRSSFEDIHVIMQTAQERKLKSVILVTSDFHLPRALFLLYAYNWSTGKNLQIQYASIQGKRGPLARPLLLYSEIVKFWGSSAELGGFLFTNQLPLDSEKLLAVRNTLKKVLLL